ncbi:MAG TPA: toxin-antitoxin system HicB family antitoxin [Stellaceae bacterium]|nr:toxin-antitoxin system HicB family antitoxin [Stellaceae bacterium]
MTSFPLRLPDDLKEKASAQAAKAGVSPNQYIAIALASRVGAESEAGRYFAARAARHRAAPRRSLRRPENERGCGPAISGIWIEETRASMPARRNHL